MNIRDTHPEFFKLGRCPDAAETRMLEALAEGLMPPDTDGCLMADLGWLSLSGFCGISRKNGEWVITQLGRDFLKETKHVSSSILNPPPSVGFATLP